MSKLKELNRDCFESIKRLKTIKETMKRYNFTCKLSHHPLHINLYYKDQLIDSSSILSDWTIDVSLNACRSFLPPDPQLPEALICLQHSLNDVEFKIIRHINHYSIYYYDKDRNWFYEIYKIK